MIRDGRIDLRDDLLTRTVYGTDNSIYQRAPRAVLQPESVSEIVDFLRANYHAHERSSIVGRGGGTGTNGQSLTDGVVIDVKKHLCRVTDYDPARLQITVEPGMVADELNAAVAEDRLFWPPHTSTTSRATIGGMIATDAAGKGSLVHGRTNRHVLSVDLLLADGTTFVAEPVHRDEAERRAASGGTSGALWTALLGLEADVRRLSADGFDLGLPELARGFSGYGLDRFSVDQVINPLALVVGSEGTLGLITSATLALSAKPVASELLAVRYESFDQALADAVRLRRTGPTAIESFDEHTLEVGRGSRHWPILDSAIGDEPGAVLLLEYPRTDSFSRADLVAAIGQGGLASAVGHVSDAADQASVWRVRADAVGLVAKSVDHREGRTARPTAFIEDCAVPVSQMRSFIKDFRSILDRHDLRYAMFGHADVGCIHVRPALDTTDLAHRTLVETLTAEITAAVRSYGGILWGEHGRGFRGSAVDAFLPAPTIDLMRRVKSAFDPEDLCNPGKLYRPLDSDQPLVEVDEVDFRGDLDREVPVEVRAAHASAFACNGNGVCHHYSPSEVMCPSYKASRDPALSPKGRADLIREWLRLSSSAREPTVLSDQLAQNLDQCLSCAACSGSCPVEVDIPQLKFQFLSEYYKSRRRPASHHILGSFEKLASVGGWFPGLTDRVVGRLEGHLGLSDLPTPRRRLRRDLPVFGSGQDRGQLDVVLLADVFTSILEPETLERTFDVLQMLGYRVAISKLVPSGKFDHVKGRRDRFEQAVAEQATLLRRIDEAGARPVGVEPATSLLHLFEYPLASGAYPSTLFTPLSQILMERVDGLEVNAFGQLSLYPHCTEQARASHWLDQWAAVLEAVGYEVARPMVGCCGMAGIFGHEKQNQAMSETLWRLSWAEPLARGGASVATGYSCRSQSKRLGMPTGRTGAAELLHPIHALSPTT